MTRPGRDAPAPGGLRLALFQPDIPQNAGTLLRTCACLGLGADLIEPAGFPTSDRHFRRAGLDYLDALVLVRHVSFTAFEQRRAERGARLVLLTTAAELDYRDAAYRSGDVLMVGRESAGVPPEVHAAADLRVTVPMATGFRSLNVAVAAAMVLGEALRQLRLGPVSVGGGGGPAKDFAGWAGGTEGAMPPHRAEVATHPARKRTAGPTRSPIEIGP